MTQKKTKLSIKRIPNIDAIILKQEGGTGFFVSTHDSIVLSVENLAYILFILVENDILPHQILEGILEGYHTSKGD